MEFRLLGPVEVRAGGRVLETGRPQQCAVLAGLVVDAGRSVPVDVLVDRVWGEAAQQRSRRALHTHIARIRRLLEQADAADDGSVRLTRRSSGYALQVDADRVDLHRFRKLVERARDPGRTGGERVVLLRQSMGLWRGEPLAGVPGEWAARMRETWQRQRLDAVVAWAQAEVQAGDPAVVIGPLTDLTSEYPLLEPLAAALMRALHATGRGVEALDCYAAVRQRLVEQLGVDPGAELQELHRAILRGSLRPAAPAVPATPAVPQVPAQLPTDVRGFTGRNGELAQLDAILADAADEPTSVVISALSGTAGVGKTALAVHWARRVADRFRDGQLYLNLRGFDPTGSALTPGEALRRLLDALGVPPAHIPESLDSQAALYRSRLAHQRVLLVLDNARDAEQVRPLLPGAAGCFVVVTSRSSLTGLIAAEGAHPLILDLLTEAEAKELMARRVGPSRVAAQPRAVDEIVRRCARLPLALVIVAARAATHPGVPLAAIAAELREARDGLDAFRGNDPATDLRAVFSWSYHTLSGEAAQLFRLLGVHPGPDVGTAAAASLAGSTVDRIRPLLTELSRTQLVIEQGLNRYAFHDLLRAYATELSRTHDDSVRRAAVHRMLDHYLHTAHTANGLLYPHRDPIVLTPAEPGVSPEDLADAGQALAWFAAEHHVLLAAIRRTAGAGFDSHTWRLAWTVSEFFDRRGHWHAGAVTQRIALEAARRVADPAGQARTHRGLARSYARLGRYVDAQTHYGYAHDLFSKIGDHAGQARTLLSLAWVLARLDRNEDALRQAQRSLDLFRTAGQRHGQAYALNAVGWYRCQLGDFREAIACCQRALALQQEMDDRSGQAGTWDSLGFAHHHLGQYRQAAVCYQRALDLVGDTDDRYRRAEVLAHLGDAHHAAGARGAAADTWQRALDVLHQLDHPEVDEIRAKLRQLDDPQPRPNLV